MSVRNIQFGFVRVLIANNKKPAELSLQRAWTWFSLLTEPHTPAVALCAWWWWWWCKVSMNYWK